jgi:nitroreductase
MRDRPRPHDLRDPDHPPDHQEDAVAAPFDLSVTDALLSTTRAVRRRLDLDRKVPREVILDCIRLSQQAPTGSNAQSWRWLVVTDPGKRAALAKAYREGGSRYLEMARSRLGEGDDQTRRVYDSAFWLMDHLEKVPVHAIPCVVGRLPEGAPNVMAASVYGSIFPAVWSFQLALRSRGLGSTLTTLHLFAEREVAELLGIPDDVMQVALLPVAYTKGGDFKVANRPDPETITCFDRWSAR